MDCIKKKITIFCKAQLSAWTASIVDFGITLSLTYVFCIWYGFSTFFGAISGGIANCIINYKWVFQSIGIKKKYIAIKYLMVWTGSILFNTYGTYILTEWSDINFIISKVIVAILVAVLWNYQMQCHFVFYNKNNKFSTKS